jgi:hypothetical protein
MIRGVNVENDLNGKLFLSLVGKADYLFVV